MKKALIHNIISIIIELVQKENRLGAFASKNDFFAAISTEKRDRGRMGIFAESRKFDKNSLEKAL